MGVVYETEQPRVSGNPRRGASAYLRQVLGMSMRVCSTPGCPTLHSHTGKCPKCKAKAARERRPHGNPYTTAGHRTFRRLVLTRDPICVLCRTAHATVADHYPIERVDLIERGLNPNDPQHGRGLCKRCHDKHTARSKPSGWNERDES